MSEQPPPQQPDQGGEQQQQQQGQGTEKQPKPAYRPEEQEKNQRELEKKTGQK